MATFNQSNLAPIGNSSFGVQGLGGAEDKLLGAPGAWSYATTDTQAQVATSGYFNDVSSLLGIGDEIRVVRYTVSSGNTTGAVAGVSKHTVLTNADGVVDISNGVTEAIANT